jgi:hypothetical protein
MRHAGTIYLARALYVIGAPLVLVWSVLCTFVIEIGRAFRYAWLDACSAWAEMRDGWEKMP